MRVIVCGGRNYWDQERVFSVLDTLAGVTAVIDGGARGADTLARRWAHARGIKSVTVPALWSEHGKAAGPIRNRRMLADFSPDLVVAFPGGPGTQNMIQQADEFRVPVMRA